MRFAGMESGARQQALWASGLFGKKSLIRRRVKFVCSVGFYQVGVLLRCFPPVLWS